MWIQRKNGMKHWIRFVRGLKSDPNPGIELEIRFGVMLLGQQAAARVPQFVIGELATQPADKT